MEAKITAGLTLLPIPSVCDAAGQCQLRL